MTLMRTMMLAAIGLAVTAPALGQSPNPQQQAEYRRSCTADYTRLCANYDPDSPQVQQCFQRRLSEVSPRCQVTIAKFSKGQRP